MDINKNYYSTLMISNSSSNKEIKKSYYKLSFEFHPDKNQEADPSIFQSIVEAYEILIDDEKKQEYDKKSKFGKDYNELIELFDINIDFDIDQHNSRFNDFKKNDVLDVRVQLEKEFNGTIKYKRWVICKSCGGSGKDLDSKIIIRDEMGNIKKIFDSHDGCDFCDGSGKNHIGGDCTFCFGKGKIGSKECSPCKGERRILGNQTLKNISLSSNKETIVTQMGNFSKYEPGKVGNLILIHCEN